jgi:NAD(P)-dependent dehydrogenase (short-subunit alcohol dehydrogenase family)
VTTTNTTTDKEKIMGRVEGKVAIVTGAASGIGAATAQLLAEHGARVVVADMNLQRAEAHAAAIRADGHQAIAIEFDLGDESSVASLIEQTVSELGGLDVLHNNAAATMLAAQQDGPVSTASAAVWDATMRINARGTVLAIKHAAPFMIERGGGSIINTSSGAALLGDLGHAAYAASKAAINAITLYAATEYGKQGIRVNAIAPGLILTDATLESGHAEHLLPTMLANMLTTRAGVPLDIAHMVLYLASDESGYVTGQVLCVDGGIMAHQPYISELREMLASSS